MYTLQTVSDPDTPRRMRLFADDSGVAEQLHNPAKTRAVWMGIYFDDKIRVNEFREGIRSPSGFPDLLYAAKP